MNYIFIRQDKKPENGIALLEDAYRGFICEMVGERINSDYYSLLDVSAAIAKIVQLDSTKKFTVYEIGNYIPVCNLSYEDFI